MKPLIRTIAAAALAAAANWGLGQELAVMPVYGPEGLPQKPGEEFTVGLRLSEPKSISGFGFRVYYDSRQTSFTGASDNTGQPGAGVSYTLGPVTAFMQKHVLRGDSADVYRDVIMTTQSDLGNVRDLALLRFHATAGFSGTAALKIVDKGPGDGLYDANIRNIPHTFAALGAAH